MLTFYLLFVYNEEDEPQFTRLYKKYDNTLLKTSNYILQNEQDAEDAVQESWIAIAQNMHILRNLDEEKIEIYIFKTVKNKSINIYHKNKKIEYNFDLNILENIPADIDVQSEYTISEEWKAAVSCLSGMDHCYRDVLTLYYLYSAKPAKIAEVLNRPLQTVKSQLQRGKHLLKEALKEWNYD
ncbi:MAG: sigma-70 family RNA polymerase sigma factor [Clostridia bacterium]|nr:sigma-70 family RNA polymerase sigma factor [Clostridia bacterium]